MVSTVLSDSIWGREQRPPARLYMLPPSGPSAGDGVTDLTPIRAADPQDWTFTALQAITNESRSDGARSYVDLHTRLIPAGHEEPVLLADYVVTEALLAGQSGMGSAWPSSAQRSIARLWVRVQTYRRLTVGHTSPLGPTVWLVRWPSSPHAPRAVLLSARAP